jgi:hypothetical protein
MFDLLKLIVMDQKLQEIKSLFRDERLQLAHNLIGQLDSNYNASENPEVEIIKADLNLANDCLELLSDLDSWDLIKQTEEIATFSKGSNTEFIVRAEMIANSSMLPILALFSEVQLLKEWVPILRDAECLSQPTKFRRIIQYKFKLPWPANDMDMVVSAVGIPIPDNKSALIILKSLDTMSEFLGVSIPHPEGTRLTLTIGCLNLTYLEPDKTQVSLIAKSNPHMPIIPIQLINYATKHGVYYFMEAVRKKAEDFKGSVFEELVINNPDYYQEIKERIEGITK